MAKEIPLGGSKRLVVDYTGGAWAVAYYRLRTPVDDDKNLAAADSSYKRWAVRRADLGDALIAVLGEGEYRGHFETVLVCVESLELGPPARRDSDGRPPELRLVDEVTNA